jgi:predicted phosphate transport protein (TIGR00153 family)
LLRKLIPRDGRFFELFESHARKVCEAAALFRELLEHSAEMEEYAKRMKAVEHQADEITHRIMDILNTTFVTPFDREDIHDLISRLDDVIDFLDATTQRMLLYNCGEPTQHLKSMAVVLQRQSMEILDALAALPKLRDSHEAIKRHCVEVSHLENEGDALLRQSMATLFNTPGVDPLYVLKWKDVYEKMEIAIDCAEDVANVLEGIVLKHA